MKKLLMGILMAFATQLAIAAPSVQDVEGTIARGDYTRAQSMLSEVVAEHPDSARAHYLYAQVLDHNGRSGEALAQIRRARQLDPQIRFTDPARLRQVERRIAADAAATGSSRAAPAPSLAPTAAPESRPAALASTRSPAGFPFATLLIVLLILAGVAVVLMWTVRRTRRRQAEGAGDIRLAQLKQATGLLEKVRALKLDLRLSSAPNAAALLTEAGALEGELSALLDRLAAADPAAPANEVAAAGAQQSPYGGAAPGASPAFALEELQARVDALEARASGREPTPSERDPSGGSRFAAEAERLGSAQTGTPPPPPQYAPQPPVYGPPAPGMGGGLGGLLTGVLLGEALGNRGERSGPGWNEGHRGDGSSGAGGDGWEQAGPGFDFGNQGQDWDNGAGGSQIDAGNGDGNWDDQT